MPSVSTTSLILAENMRVTRSMSKVAAQGCVAVIVRRPLSNMTPSVNTVAMLPAKRKASAPKSPPAKPAVSVPLPYKNGFGFSLGGAPRTPEECERLRKERLAFFCRVRAYQRKNLPKIELFTAPTIACGEQYIREYVGRRTSFYRIIPSPSLLAPPATGYGGQILHPDMFPIVPEIREHVPPAWDEWCPTGRPEHDPEVNKSMLFVPQTTSSGDFYAEDLVRYFPVLWRKVRAKYTREVLTKKKKRFRLSKLPAVGGRRRLQRQHDVLFRSTLNKTSHSHL